MRKFLDEEYRIIPTNYYISPQQRFKRIKTIKSKRKPFVVFSLLPKDEQIKFKARFWAQRNRKHILEKMGAFCDLCKTKEKLEIHHKKYTNNFKDLQVLCRKCHMRIEQGGL